MEYLDIYDEEGNHIGKQDRKIVHRDGLWHKTIHCWLYDKKGNVYFQIRKGEGLFTTASGHVKEGETVEEGFAREIYEELGVRLDIQSALLFYVKKIKLDILKKDGSMYRDRAFQSIFLYDYEDSYKNFKFDENEIDGLVKLSAKDVLKIFKNECSSITGTVFKNNLGEISAKQEKIKLEDFLINKGETGVEKHGKVLEKIIKLTEEKN